MKKLESNWSYDNITYNLFSEVVRTGDTSLLGGINHQEVWESIVSEYSKSLGLNTYDIHKERVLKLYRLMAKYVYERASLIHLSLEPEKQSIEELNKRGYKISIGSNYAETIEASLKRCNDLIVKIKLISLVLDKQKEINKNIKSDPKKDFFKLERALGYSIDKNLLLKDFVYYIKILEEEVVNKKK